MPPPELFDRPAPASVGALVLENIRAEAPMSRHTGPIADEARLRAALADSRTRNDAAAEREASIALARLLASRGRDLGVATKLARRALMIQEDHALRTELAGWLAGLGDCAGAAAALRGLCDPEHPGETTRTLVKIAVLLARSGDAAGAAETLDEAAALDPIDAMAIELFGTLTAWAPETVAPEGAAAAYLEAALRREATKDKEAAFEDRLRAFEIAPHDEAAAAAIAATLAARGRIGAADEVTRAHAEALARTPDASDPERAAAVHRRRMLAAHKEVDAARAVGAVLDARFEGDVDGPDAAKVDEVLAHAGLYELLAARLEVRADGRSGAARGDVFQELARLHAGPLASPDRAIEAWIDALGSDPSNGAARAALRDHASAQHDRAPLVEALVRAGGAAEGDPEARIKALRELASLADEKLDDPALASWALDRMAAEGSGGDLVQAEKQRLASRLRRHEEALAEARRAASSADSTEARIKALRKLVPLQHGLEGDRDELCAALAELARALPAERSFLIALERIAHRTLDFGPLETALRDRVASALPRVELVRARLGLAAIARRRGDEARALDEVLPLLTEAPGHRGAACAALLLATRVGRARERAEALVQLGGPEGPALRSTLLAVAAELFAATSAPELARRTAEQACEADPSNPRAVATLAAIAGQTPDRLGAAALDRAMGVVLPRGAWCQRLASAFDALGEIGLAIAWTQRWLALRPGSHFAMEELLRRATAARDPARIGDALSWVLAQPKPLADLTEAITAALEVMLELDRNKARTLARRALDVVGPRVPILRARLLGFSERAADPGLAIAVLERYLAAEALGPFASELLLELSRRRTQAGDFDGAARELLRAAEAATDPGQILAHGVTLETGMREAGALLGSDGLVALAEARALAFTALGPDSAATAAMAWRELGSLRWDLAADRRGAEEAFFRASELAPRGGVERYARDLCEFAGVSEAIDALLARAGRAQGEGAQKVRANLLIEAANLASTHGLAERALHAAASAIESDPSRADAVALVEKNAHVEGGLPLLDRTYDLLAAAALGCYGRRAAHYRGARQLERRGAIELSLRHAVASFEAVPAEGTAYVMLARLADRVGDPTEAVRALERVAESGNAGARTTWLKRAAVLAGKTEEGARVRFDLLLRALNVSPEPGTVADVAASIDELISWSGEADAVADVVGLRLERAVKSSLPKLDGPDGARAAVLMARLLSRLGATELAFAALERAMSADGDIDEFASLSDAVPVLAGDAEGARAYLASVRAAAERPYSSVGAALLRFAATLATALGDAHLSASLLVQALRHAADDAALVIDADRAAAALGDAEVTRKLDAVLAPARRLEVMLEAADEHERAGNVALAIAALDRVVASEAAATEVHERAALRLRRLLAQSGRTDDAEALLRAELAGALPAAARVRAARDLAEILAARGEHREALDVLASAAHAGADADLLGRVRELAHRTGDIRRYADVLTLLAQQASDDAARLALLRELAPLCQELGDTVAAGAHYEAISRLDPADAETLEALERDAAERGDHERMAALLARRIELTTDADRRRMLRLRRAAALEQRLGRLEDAAHELEALLAEAPDDVSALRYLADMHERLERPLRAAELLHRLADLAMNSDEKADYALRAAGAYAAGGEHDAAESLLEAVAPLAQREAVMEARVVLARAKGDGRALAEALDQLAATSRDPAERRAAILIEAARVASMIGDDAAALDRARRALKLAPSSPEAILEARRTEYRSGGMGTPREAQAAVDDLTRIERALDPSLIELHVFLLAEALDVIQGGGAGMRELSRRHAAIGPAPLIALGMAERLVRGKNFETALPLFDRALAGDLRGVRSPGRVALAAAEAAISAQELDTAARLLELAAAEPEVRAIAERKQLELTATRGTGEVARAALDELAQKTTGVDRARVLLQLGKMLATSDPDGAERAYAEAAKLAGSDRVLAATIGEAVARLGVQRQMASPHEAPPATQRSSAPPPLATAAAQRPVAPPPSAPPAAASLAGPPAPPPDAPARPAGWVSAAEHLDAIPPSMILPVSDVLTGGRAAIEAAEAELGLRAAPARARPSPDDEQQLLRELGAGSFDAGERLLALYGPRAPERTLDVLAIRRQQAMIRLGDRAAIERLYQAAIHDGNTSYARAVEHVLHAFDPAGNAPAPPPPLAGQRLAPELVAALLFRSIADSAVHEALSLVLDTGLYRRDVGQYQLTGVARVQPGAATVLGDVYGVVSRFLGQARTALFHQRAPSPDPAAKAPISTKIALLAPPAIVLTGEVRDETPELRYLLGAALTGAMPEHALVNALNEESLRTLIDALLAAFGPVANLPKGNAAVARLGQNLWQLVPPRADRRLRELCADTKAITYEAAISGTRQAMRRAGLFASGSLRTTLLQCAAEIPLTPDKLATPDGLALACAAHADVANLVRLAIRTEFAEARWLTGAAPDRRRADPGPRSRAGT